MFIPYFPPNSFGYDDIDPSGDKRPKTPLWMWVMIAVCFALYVLALVKFLGGAIE